MDSIVIDTKDLRCIYHQFPGQVGINKGNFIEMVSKKYFEEQGYNVESLQSKQRSLELV